MQGVLTSYSLAVALRVVKNIGEASKGATPESDTAFRIVAAVLEKLLARQTGRG